MYTVAQNIFSSHIAVFLADDSNFNVLKMAQCIQEEFSTVFPTTPEILPLPSDAPREFPRCTFRNSQNTTLTLSLNRIDYDAIENSSNWKNNIRIILLNLFNICNDQRISTSRVGIVIHSTYDDIILSRLNDLISIECFKGSHEKHISYVTQKNIDDISLNIITDITYNSQNQKDKLIFVDVNTNQAYILPENISEKMNIVELIITEIEEKLANVF